MSLLSKLREKQRGQLATATPATFATDEGKKGRVVATVATVTVAKSAQELSASLPMVGAGNTAPVSRCPAAIHAETQEWHPVAAAVNPSSPPIRQVLAPLTTKEETAIRAWLALIEETDPVAIAGVIGQCQRDANARSFFTERAASALPMEVRFPDDRRTCDQCANLIVRRCQAAKRGEIVASPNYEPIRDQLRRCESYAPTARDADRRSGRERWPGLIQKGDE